MDELFGEPVEVEPSDRVEAAILAVADTLAGDPIERRVATTIAFYAGTSIQDATVAARQVLSDIRAELKGRG